MENNVNQQPGLDSFLKTWWQSHLFGTKLILTISSIFGLIDLFTHYAFDILSNSPDSTIPFQIQRLFFANFVHYYSIDMILAIICISNRLKDFETKNGTVQFIIIIFIQGFITQSICLLLQFVFSFIYPPFSQAPAYSLWNFAIFFIIQDCLMIPNGQSKFLIFQCNQKQILSDIIYCSLQFNPAIFDFYQLLHSGRHLLSIFGQFQPLASNCLKMENGIIFKHFIEQIDFKRITNYQDQIEFSVDSREIPQIQTPPAKLTIEGSAPFPPSLLLQELQKQLNTKGGKIRERVQEVEEQKQMEQKTEEYDL